MTVLLPVVLMMGKALADIFALKGTAVRSILDFLGEPMFALLLTTLLAIFTLGKVSGMNRDAMSDSVGAALPRSLASYSPSPPAVGLSRSSSTLVLPSY